VIGVTHKFQRQVNVEDCEDLTKEVFCHLGTCTFLRSLNLSGTLVDSIDFLSELKDMLTELKLSRTPVVDFCMLQSCRNLSLLELCHTKFCDVKVLVNCCRLRRLDLAGKL